MAGTIAVIGLGAIGEPIAATLIKAGFNTLVVPHRRRESAERLASQGATIVDTPKDAAAQSDYLLTCVPEGPDLETASQARQLLRGAGEMIVDVDRRVRRSHVEHDAAA